MVITPPLTLPTTRQVQWASQTQRDAFFHGPTPICLSGGWGAGKTWDGCLKALWLSTTYPKNRGVIARHVGKELRETTMATWFKICEPRLYDRTFGGRRNDQNGYLKLARSQSEILFIHLDDPETEGIIRGLEINWFLIDQAEENPEHMEEIFDMLLGRLGRWDQAEVPAWMVRQYQQTYGRPWPYVHPERGTPVPPSYAMLCCNPDIETHWIYRRFHDESHEHQQHYKARGYKMFYFPSEENRFLGDTNLQYLLDHDEAFVRRNVKGLWGMPEGAIHAVDAKSVIEGEPSLLDFFRNHCLLFRTLDHGDSSPTCCTWWAVDREGNVFAYREYYLGHALVSTHRGNISALSEGEHYDLDLADPSIFFKMPQRQGGRWAVSDEYADCLDAPRQTAIFWHAADNAELSTRNRINEFLRVNPERVHPMTREKGSPRLFFVKINDSYPQGCYHLLRETRSQRRVKIGTDLGKPIYSDERDPSVPDNSYDCLRYAISSRSPAPSASRPAEEGTFFQARQRLAELQRRRMGIR